MNTWPRRIPIILLFVIPTFVVASVSGAAQTVDSDTAVVGLIVTNNGCPYESKTVSSSLVAYSADGWSSDIGAMMLAQADDSKEGDCPPESETATDTVPPIPDGFANETAVATDAVGGSSSTVPVVAQLPETGVAPSNSASATVLMTLLTAGFLAAGAGVLSSRVDSKRPVR